MPGCRWLCLFALAGCYVRDAGHDYRPGGAVEASALCSAAAPGCPPCTVAEGGLCRDQFYPSAFRCDGDGQCGGASCASGYCVFLDADGDGLDDAFEREIAERNFPRLSVDPYDACPGPRLLLYRVRRHPSRADRFAVTYVDLYNRDCGTWNGHLGDNESFAITFAPDAAPCPAATVGFIADAHRHTACESISTCATTPETGACAKNGAITVYASRDKHGSYLDKDTCEDNCFDKCGDLVAAAVPLVDTGQPDHPLTRDLTDENWLLVSDGWFSPLTHFNVWGDAQFGDAGYPKDQLTNLLAPVDP